MIELEATSMILLSAIVWTAVLIYTLGRIGDRRLGSTGLTFAFLCSYTTVHSGALVHLIDGYIPQFDAYLAAWQFTRETVALGFEASTLAMVAAVLGFGMVDKYYARHWKQIRASNWVIAELKISAWVLVVIGSCALGFERITDVLGVALPGFQAAISSARNLFVVGGCGLVLHRLLLDDTKWAMIYAACFTIGPPLLFLITTAILSDSITIGLACFTFYLTLRSQGKQYPFAFNAGLFGAVCLSGFLFAVVWLQIRDDMRAILWSGGSIESAVKSGTGGIGALDSGVATEFRSLSQIDGRMNQNIFIGMAIENLKRRPEGYENGETIFLALLGWVPRFVWIDKPERGGSSMLAKHTLRMFSQGTTVGAGPIFEFFVNYGYVGVFVGFIVLGGLVRLFDILAARAIRQSNGGEFAQYYLAGLALLQPLADLLFLVTAVTSALLLGMALRLTMRRVQMRPGRS